MHISAYLNPLSGMKDLFATIMRKIRKAFSRLFPNPDGCPELPLERHIDPFDEAISALGRWYYSEVIVEELRSRRYLDEEEETNYVWEACDGHEFIIYTFKAKCVLLASDNSDAYDEEIGEDGATTEQRAFWAFKADVLRFMEYAYKDEGVSNE